MNRRDIIYHDFEIEIESAPDERIRELLSPLKKDDYLRLPIVFDLIAEKRLSVLNYLYKQGIPFSYTDGAGGTVLHVACGAAGSLQAVQFLIQNNIATDINVTTDENETPFLLAIMYGHLDIVEYLLTHFKPDLRITTTEGESMFSLAQKNGKRMFDLLGKYTKAETVV